MINQLKPIWVYIENEVKQTDKNANLMNAVSEFETEAAVKGFSKSILTKMEAANHSQVKIVDFTDQYKDDIKRLNYEWLEKYFAVEQVDVKSLSNPRKEIIEKGGHIFLAVLDQEVVGTASLLKITDKLFELGKMAVTGRTRVKKSGSTLSIVVLKKRCN